MKKYGKIIAMFLSSSMVLSSCISVQAEEQGSADSDKAYIEETLNLANNEEQEWTYSADADAWVLSVVSAVAYPELPNQQGVSVCVPGAYVTGIDTDGDGNADVTAETAGEAVKGALVIDYEAEITSTNGQVYTAATAPVILNTGAAGYGSQSNSKASTSHAADGYINVSCGNRGKQDSVTDENGNTVYTGDAPSCLVDQKAAARYVKYNILLGNLPGNVNYFVSTGGSGGGAHAAMFAATSNNSDYYDYQIEAGAVGVYKNEDGTYSTTVSIDGTEYELSDGAWGCIAYSSITSLYEADMALAFEYNLDTEYSFKTSFQAQMAEYLSASYMEYINEQNLSVEEAAVGFDLNEDGDLEDTIALTIEYDAEAHADTNGYFGTYLDLYLAEFTQNLQWYLDNLDYAEGWTWFDADGQALSDEAVAAMTSEEKAAAFIEGRYSKGSSGGMMGGMGMMGGLPGGDFDMSSLPEGMEEMLGNLPDDGFDMSSLPGGDIDMSSLPDGAMPGGDADMSSLPDGITGGRGGKKGNLEVENAEDGTAADVTAEALPADMEGTVPSDIAAGEVPADMEGTVPTDMAAGELPADMEGMVPNDMAAGELPSDMQQGNLPGEMVVGTPDSGTTQSASGSGIDSSNYASYEEMAAAYKADIEEVYAGDEYGKNIVELYNPLNYIGEGDTENPVWTKIIMGAAEGDISMFNSLNLQIAWLNAGVNAEIEWQWDGGHVPSEVLGDSFSLYVDQMYGEYVEGAVSVSKAEAAAQTANGTSEEATGTDISSWISYEDTSDVSFTLADAAAYRTAGASKAMPGFDVIDYGQEDYVFGDAEQDARHWDIYVLEILEEYADVLEPLFNASM